ncbi:RNA polymerase sigma factor [Kribbella sp. NPDC051587]|uniref:RNA polymerase sigma factor n=1 Tax=Kribbella sp. NPDC051587 TaxID=3364119 RepID=UPI0037A60E7D
MTIALTGRPEGLPTTMSDGELWRRSVEGETEAFGVLFDRHARAVYNFLFRRTASWSDAEDLTSLVFLHAWRRREDVVLVHDSALPWLLRTADYVLRNEWRKQHFRRLNLLRQGPAADVPDHAEHVAARIDDEREAKRLRALLRKLPRHEREIVELCFWSGLDAQSAAVALDIPLGTVKSRMSRARKRLRDLSVAVSTVEDPS